MRLAPLAAVALASLATVTGAAIAPRALAAQPRPLAVLRHSPDSAGRDAQVITVRFDRPVVARLEDAVPAARVLRIAPALPGRAEWRDPVTLRFVFDEPVAPGTVVRVVVDTLVRGVDGARLAAPYTFAFRVRGPVLLARSFARGNGWPLDTLAPDATLRLLYSAPVDTARLAAAAHIAVARCGDLPARTVGVRVAGVRARDDDPFGRTRWFGRPYQDSIRRHWQRVVDLVPVSPLPEGCDAVVTIPTTADDAVHGASESYRVRTAPPFALRGVLPATNGLRRPDSLALVFTAHVRRDDLARHVRVACGGVRIRPDDGADRGDDRDTDGTPRWLLGGRVRPHVECVVQVDPALRDVHGRAVVNPGTTRTSSGGFDAALALDARLRDVARAGVTTIPVRHRNLRALRVITGVVPAARRGAAVVATLTGLGEDDLWRDDRAIDRLVADAAPLDTQVVPLTAPPDVERVTRVAITPRALAPGGAGLVVARIEGIATLATGRVPLGSDTARSRTIDVTESVSGSLRLRTVVLQRTDLALTVRLAPHHALAFVTRVGDGAPVAGALVRRFDPAGRVVAAARTGADGTVELRDGERVADAGERIELTDTGKTADRPARAPHVQATLVDAQLGDDRVVTVAAARAIGYTSWDGLDPTSLGGERGWARDGAAMVVAGRGIVRPGEWLHLKAIVRRGPLGALVAAAGDTIRVVVRHAEVAWRWSVDDGSEAERAAIGTGALRDTTIVLGAFGTLADSVPVPFDARLGGYVIEIARRGEPIASTWLRVEEYRAPEFLLAATDDDTMRQAGDSARIAFAGRYLFGAPMAKDTLSWHATFMADAWSTRGIPGAEGWITGDQAWWAWRDWPSPSWTSHGRTTLDAAGRATVVVPLTALPGTGAGRLVVHASVSDVARRQFVGATATATVRASRLQLLARESRTRWWWRTREPVSIAVRAVLPDGRDSAGVAIVATVARIDWRYVDWRWTPVERVVQRAVLRSGPRAGAAARLRIVPATSGSYVVRLVGVDGRGDTLRTSWSRWATGGDRSSMRDSLRLPLIATRDTLAPGDTTSVVVDSPFDEAEALVTVEREKILERRRLVVRRGATAIPLRITGAHVPNVFVSVLLVPRTGAVRHALPARPSERVRVGFARLAVGTDTKRLAVAVTPRASEYRPGDSARVDVTLRDHAGAPVRGEVALWAVDEGVLALTGYEAPDPIAALHAPRGIGTSLVTSLASLLSATAPRLGERIEALLRRAPNHFAYAVVTGAAENGGVARPRANAPASVALRERFRSTAFFVAAARTDADGVARIAAKLPDDLTTFRLMALAVDAGDRVGAGEAPLLVSRPLVARPTLPRFVRPADTLVAGAVVDVRGGGARPLRVEAAGDGLALLGAATRELTIAPGAGREARFDAVVPARDAAGDSVRVQLRASDGREGDAVRRALPVRPDFRRRVHATIGVLRAGGEAELVLPEGTDLARSTLALRVGTTPLAPMVAAVEWLRTYPYECTEQLVSGGRALLAAWRAGARGDAVADAPSRVRALVAELARRQGDDGAIRYWRDDEWTSPWVGAWSLHFLLDAREAGIAVDSTLVSRLATWLRTKAPLSTDTGGMSREARRERRLALGGAVAVAAVLRRAGTPAPVLEDSLLAAAPAMTFEDRLHLADALAARADRRAAARALLDAAWRTTRVVGARVELPDSAHGPRLFPSRVAPAARLVLATRALEPAHPRLGGLVSTLLVAGRARGARAWNTQDYASAVLALASLEPRGDAARTVRVVARGRTLLEQREHGDTARRLPLADVATIARDGTVRVRVALASTDGDAPLWYALTVDEVPAAPPVRPDDGGMIVERWYERADDGRPVTTVREGDLVRVRLRVTVPTDRYFVALEDPLPAGVEVVDPSLATTPAMTRTSFVRAARDDDDDTFPRWSAGTWRDGGWTPWEHQAFRDDRVVHAARLLPAGRWSASYVVRATTAGHFVRPPAVAEEMYDPAVQGRSDGGRFVVVPASSP